MLTIGLLLAQAIGLLLATSFHWPIFCSFPGFLDEFSVRESDFSCGYVRPNTRKTLGLIPAPPIGLSLAFVRPITRNFQPQSRISPGTARPLTV